MIEHTVRQWFEQVRERIADAPELMEQHTSMLCFALEGIRADRTIHNLREKHDRAMQALLMEITNYDETDEHTIADLQYLIEDGIRVLQEKQAELMEMA